MPGPIVTVVTPSYNQGKYIRATIESVLAQDYPRIEYIVMDGGSTDETAAVVKDYASRLTFISEKDRGQSHAINKGFKMAQGSILAWLNSDDLYLPGAVRKAVNAFKRNPGIGAVYGEGYLIDALGQNSTRFPCSEPFNLWKLVHLSDYVLQQTSYFRKDVLDDVGYLNESLDFTMDWDIFIRIGMKYPLEFIPEYMGCLREYPEAKSSAGGARRIREIRDLLRGHTGMRIPPGYIVYGLDTYHRIWCGRIERLCASNLKPVGNLVQSAIRLSAGLVISRTIRESQGLYSDGWAGRLLRYMLPPGDGSLLVEGVLPNLDALYGQRIRVQANGVELGAFDLPQGPFQIEAPLPPELHGKPVHLKIRSVRSWTPSRLALTGDRRRLAYQLKSIRWAAASCEDVDIVTPAAAAC